jgi:hypothetical protein
MFTTKQIGIDLAGCRLNVREEEDERLTIAEVNLIIDPWPVALLRELGDEAATHVFLADGRVKPELKTVKIAPTRGRLQRLHFASALDVVAEHGIEPAIVQWFKFDRRDEEKTGRIWVKGTIRVDLEYRDKAVRDLLAKRFGTRCFLSTIGLEGRLNFDAPAPEPDEPRKPRLMGIEIADATLETSAPAADPEAGDVLDEQRGRDDAARTDLHTGRSGGTRGGRKPKGDEPVH